MVKIVVIIGLSGAGKSVALSSLEDSGFVCINNLPINFLEKLFDVSLKTSINNIAISIDLSRLRSLKELDNAMKAIKSDASELMTIFLDASKEVLAKRYSESRRKHPLTNNLMTDNKTPSLIECINYEKLLFSDIKNRYYTIDTTNLSPIQLKAYIKEVLKVNNDNLLLTLQSFSYRRGIPCDSDIVFDVRCLPNPYYEENLRNLTGKNNEVEEWLNKFDIVNNMVEDIINYINKWLPEYKKNTRNYLTIAIGCTGGKHRSVYVVEQLAKKLISHKYLLVKHREEC